MSESTVETIQPDKPIIKLERWRNRPNRITRSQRESSQMKKDAKTKEENLRSVMPLPDVFPSEEDGKRGAYFDGKTPPRKNIRKQKPIVLPEVKFDRETEIETAVIAMGQDDLFPDILAPPNIENTSELTHLNSRRTSIGTLSNDISDAFKGMDL